MPPSDPSTASNARGSRPLARALAALAGTPEDAPSIDAHLVNIAGLAVDRVAAVAYASIMAVRGEHYTTVVASSDLVRAVDEAQYADGAEPCMQVLHEPGTVPQVRAPMLWPRFREEAPGLGLCASVPLPLYVGSGAAAAVLILYGHNQDAMAPLIVGVWSLYDSDLPMLDGSPGSPVLEPGAAELIDGLAEAMVMRATILTAVTVIMTSHQCGNAEAHAVLRRCAAAGGTDLVAAAAAVIARGA